MITHGRGGSDLWGSSLSDSSSEAVVMHGAFITTPTALVLRPTDVAARSGACGRAWFAGEIFTGTSFGIANPAAGASRFEAC